jgi:predicted acylesterase/phospholipase RssA
MGFNIDLNPIPRFAIYKDKKINKSLQLLFKNTEAEDLWLPFFCILSNISDPQMVAHERGSLNIMIRVSMSVPGLFKPVFIDNNVLVDGGLFNNVPVDVMMKKKVKYIIASRVDKGEKALEGGAQYPRLFNTFIKSTIANSDSHSNRFQSFVDLVF